MPVWFVHPSWAFVVFFFSAYQRMNSNRTVHAYGFTMQETSALFTGPTTTLFRKYIYIYIKNGSHNTIYTFKNYFATVFLVFSFQQNKLYPNGLLVIYHYFKTRVSCVIRVPYKIATKFASYTTNSSFKNSSFKIIIDY